MQHFAIIGGGAWGTALACALRRAGRDVLLWAREAEVVAAVNAHHENTLFLGGVGLDPAIRASGALADAGQADAVLLVPPAQHLRAVLAALVPHLGATTPLVVCSKGIEHGSLNLMSEVTAQTAPGRPLAVLSGPTFAVEVARGLPTAVTLATTDVKLGRQLVQAIGSAHFRPYLSDDPVGAQVGGAVKNVLAIACGLIMGRRLGDNARAALVTRGLAEMMRLGLALGAKAPTLMGLAGLGDLTLTCMGIQSRNFSLGKELGAGAALAKVLAARNSVAEGVHSAAATVMLAARHQVEMPIAAAVDAILNRGADIDATIEALLARPFRAESEF
jgi:glycerol-3-phosphate dehydrogenase (NAD(P)+)